MICHIVLCQCLVQLYHCFVVFLTCCVSKCDSSFATYHFQVNILNHRFNVIAVVQYMHHMTALAHSQAGVFHEAHRHIGMKPGTVHSPSAI